MTADPNTLADEQLFELSQKTGDKHFVATAFLRHAHLVFAVCMQYLGQYHAAQDAVQEIFIKISDISPQKSVQNFKSFVFITARNHCINVARKKTVWVGDEKLHGLPEEPEAIADLEEKEKEIEQLFVCMGCLNEDQRMALEYFYYGKKSYNEIARLTGHDWKKVRSLIQNGKKNLANCMKKV